MNPIIAPLAKYASPAPTESPPDILPWDPHDPWSLDGSARLALDLLAQGEKPGPRLYQVADYLLTFCTGGYGRLPLPLSEALLLNGAALALCGYLCEGQHPEAELWRVTGCARLASQAHWRKASVSDQPVADCIGAVCAMAEERQMPICADLLTLQERLWGRLVDHSRAERLHVSSASYGDHMLTPDQAPSLGLRLRDRAWQYDIDLPEPHLTLDLVDADNTCNNLITLRAHMLVRHQFGSEIDWHLRLFDDKESTVSLAHHGFITNLAAAYAETADKKYAQHAARLLTSFCRLAPLPNHQQPGGPWRTLEVGNRQANHWPFIIAALGQTEAFGPDMHAMLAASRLEHMRFATAFCGGANNWYQVEAAGMATAALYSPELRQADAYLRVALRRLRWINSFAYYDDGQQFELSHGYHKFPTSSMFAVVETARARGVSLPQDFVALVEKAHEMYLYAMMPDHRLPTFNDSNPNPMDPAGVLAAAARVFHRPDLRWGATYGQEGTEPDHASHAWPSAGYYVMRDKWGPDAEYLLFDGAAWGASHQHEDKLNFCLYAKGRQLIGDPNIYSYAQTPLTHYFKSSRGHNVILVDGRGQARKHLPEAKLNRVGRNEWVSTTHFDFVSSEYLEGFVRDPYGEMVPPDEIDSSITHRRAIFYVKPGYWILCDLVQANDDQPHTLEQIYHLAPLETPDAGTPYTAGLVDATPQAIVTRDPGVGNIAILPVADGPLEVSRHKGELQPAAGWWGMKGEYPAWEAVHQRRTTLPARMDTVLYPIESGQANYPSVERLASDADVTALRIRGQGLDDTFILCEEGTGRITVGDITFEGRAVLLRREPHTRAYGIGIRTLTVAGIPIRPNTEE